MPLWLDLGGLRVVHACWDNTSTSVLGDPTLTAEMLRAEPGDRYGHPDGTVLARLFDDPLPAGPPSGPTETPVIFGRYRRTRHTPHRDRQGGVR